jgi:hypothetical protein
MPEGRAGLFGAALLGVAARRVRLLTIVVLVAAVCLIAGHDAAWTGIGVVGIAVLAVAIGWLGLAAWSAIPARSDGARGGAAPGGVSGEPRES